jgi:hypothetical protein
MFNLRALTKGGRQKPKEIVTFKQPPTMRSRPRLVRLPQPIGSGSVLSTYSSSECRTVSGRRNVSHRGGSPRVGEDRADLSGFAAQRRDDNCSAEVGDWALICW